MTIRDAMFDIESLTVGASTAAEKALTLSNYLMEGYFVDAGETNAPLLLLERERFAVVCDAVNDYIFSVKEKLDELYKTVDKVWPEAIKK